MDLFSISDILSLEQEIVALLPENTPIETGYIKQPVALYLFQAYKKSGYTDTRLLTYSLPLIQSLMIRYRNLLNKYEKQEVFQTLVLDLLETLPKYQESKGSYFTFATKNVQYRILDYNRPNREKNKREAEGKIIYEEVQITEYSDNDPIDGYHYVTNDKSVYQLLDFISFLNKLEEIEGPTARKMLQALSYLIQNQPEQASQGQQRIVEMMVKDTGYPVELIQPYYQKVLRRYATADLPY